MQSIAILTEPVSSTVLIEPYRAVTKAGAYPVAGAAAFGITEYGSDEVGQHFAVTTLGTAVAELEADADDDELLEVGTDGKLIPKNIGTAVARARQAGVAGTKIEVFVLIPTT